MSLISKTQLIKDIADAYRTASGTSDLVRYDELTQKISELSTESAIIKNVTMDSVTELTITDQDDVEHEVVPTYTNNRITSITYDGTSMAVTYDGDGNLTKVGNCDIDGTEEYIGTGIVPSGSLSITENGTYDVTEKASAVVNVQGGGAGLPINIASSCPSPFLLNQNNITSNVKYIFPTTTASVVPVGGVTVNYIQSGGTQYIDTGVVPANHEVVAKFQYTEATNDSCIFGVTSTTYHLTWYSSKWFYACGNGERSFNGTQCTDLQVVDFNNANQKIVMNDVEYASTNGTVSVSGNLTIFGRGGASQLCKAKLYYLKIYDRSTNTLVRDFVPAISQETGHTNEVCLYDNVTEAYLYNQGTGTFTYGEDVIPITEVDVGDEVETVLSPANSYATFSYQWQKLQNDEYVNISGATSSTYTAQTGDNAIRCILTGTGNSEGTITSSSITVNEVD